jgi:two-component system sensor histidine kinase KdpD
MCLLSVALLVSIIAFLRCRFGKETGMEQHYPVLYLEALLLVKYNGFVKIIRRSIMKHQQRQEDILFSVCIFFGAFAINLLIRKLFTTQTLVPMIFVFGVFLISLKTHGYCYGIVSAVLSVFAVNFAFTYPYYTLDFFVEESILSAIIMLVVAVSTSTLNSRIRDQENLRAESEKERMRGNLLRAISHDLRTPLTSIYGSSSTLISKKDALSEEQQLKLLGEIQEDSEWLIRMVENLLAVTRIDGAKVKVVKTPIVLDELIDSVLMKFSKKHPNQKVITQIPADFVDIPMDSILIEQVLLNFLENAVFHAKGMTELKLSVSLAGDKAVFEVSDNGCGIPEEILDKIFTGCYKKSAAPIDGTRSNMGIGISVCAAIIKAHGSEIFVENRKGGGAVLRFSLARGCDDEQ